MTLCTAAEMFCVIIAKTVFSFLSLAWAQAVAALMIIGLLILIICFIMSCIALCCSFNLRLMLLVGLLLFVAGKFMILK